MSVLQSLLVSPKARPKRDLSLGTSRASRILAAALNSKENKSPLASDDTLCVLIGFYHKPFAPVKRSLDSSLRDQSSSPSLFSNEVHISPERRPFSLSPNGYSPRLPPPQKKIKMESSPDGFINLGNTCYLNAVLQSLLGLRCFALDIVQCNLGPSVESRSLFRMLYLLVKSKYSGDNLASQIILITKIRHIICARAKEFHGFNEQDAHELLTHCLSNLRADITYLLEHKVSDICPVEVNFKSCIEQTLTCLKCQNTITNHEEVLDLPLNFITSDRNSLQELLEDYFQNEDVDYKCSNCGHNLCQLSRKLSLLPRVLILTLKRYSLNDYGSCDKRLEPVRISRYLNMSPVSQTGISLPAPHDNSKDVLGPLMGHVIDKKNDSILSPRERKSSINYRLTSVISHVGNSSSSGHYVSEVHCPITNTWWHCNDSKVTMTTEEHVRQDHQTKAYILFYVHQ